MKTHMMFIQVLKQSILGATLIASVPAFAQSVTMSPIDPKGELAKLVGEITSSDSDIRGNAFVVGNNGCYVLTNFHVAFGLRKDPVSGDITTVSNPSPGRTVNFSFDLNSRTGKFQRTMKATVVEYATYVKETGNLGRGTVGDMALLKLEDCLGKEYGNLVVDRPTTEKTPSGTLMTISSVQLPDGTRSIVSQAQCEAAPQTTVVGLFISNCDMPPGSSGSMVLRQVDGQWKLAGMPVRQITRGEEKVNVAIYSKAIVKFLDSALGEAPIAIAPVARERAPQSDAQTASLKPRTTVR